MTPDILKEDYSTATQVLAASLPQLTNEQWIHCLVVYGLFDNSLHSLLEVCHELYG